MTTRANTLTNHDSSIISADLNMATGGIPTTSRTVNADHLCILAVPRTLDVSDIQDKTQRN
jgi:hypothetical protein